MPLERDEETALRAAEGGAEKSEYVRRAFSEIAPRYDFLNHLLSFNIDKGWRRKAIRELALDRKPRGRGGLYSDPECTRPRRVKPFRARSAAAVRSTARRSIDARRPRPSVWNQAALPRCPKGARPAAIGRRGAPQQPARKDAYAKRQ